MFTRYEKWVMDVERTDMRKSYKMIVLLAMLQRGPSNWNKPITPEEVAPFFHHYLMDKEYRKKLDFSDKSSKRLWEYNEQRVSRLIATMPMTMWKSELTSFENNIFKFTFDIAKEDEEILFKWTKEICEYRLHYHFERKANSPLVH